MHPLPHPEGNANRPASLDGGQTPPLLSLRVRPYAEGPGWTG